MKALSTSEEQVMAALWACGKPANPAADRSQTAAGLCVGGFHTAQLPAAAGSQGLCAARKAGQQKYLYPAGAPCDLLRGSQCGTPANSVWRGPAQHGGGVIGYRTIGVNAEMERLARWLDTRVAESPEYDYD